MSSKQDGHKAKVVTLDAFRKGSIPAKSLTSSECAADQIEFTASHYQKMREGVKDIHNTADFGKTGHRHSEDLEVWEKLHENIKTMLEDHLDENSPEELWYNVGIAVATCFARPPQNLNADADALNILIDYKNHAVKCLGNLKAESVIKKLMDRSTEYCTEQNSEFGFDLVVSEQADILKFRI